MHDCNQCSVVDYHRPPTALGRICPVCSPFGTEPTDHRLEIDDPSIGTERVNVPLYRKEPNEWRIASIENPVQASADEVSTLEGC
jgi:hypothetical protein